MGLDKPSRTPKTTSQAPVSARDATAHRKGPILEPKGYRGLTLEEAAEKTPPTILTDTEAMIDMAKLRCDRQARLREALRGHDVAAGLLLTPHSLRYATGLRNCAIYQAHIPANNVEQLGQLIQAEATQETTDPGYAGVGFRLMDLVSVLIALRHLDL